MRDLDGSLFQRGRRAGHLAHRPDATASAASDRQVDDSIKARGNGITAGGSGGSGKEQGHTACAECLVPKSRCDGLEAILNNPKIHADEEPLGDLFRRFAKNAAALIRHEIALAKLEMTENLRAYAQDAVRVGIAAGVGILGLLALTAFVIAGLGELINSYWASSLIVAVVLLAIAGILARGAIAHIKRRDLAPEETVRTLREEKQWIRSETKDFKRKLRA